jgi:hypothetical protein
VPLTVKLPDINALPVAKTSVVFMFPELALPVTIKLDNVPTEVMFGCALV